MAACYGYGIRSRSKEDSVYARLDPVEKTGVDSCNFLLESYHYCKSPRATEIIRIDKTPVFLDSGAFSAYTLGITLSVEEYCNYIKANKDIIRVEDGLMLASVLDGIGDPLATWRNQNEMEYRGIKALPCFHAGEDEKFLEHYINNYEYITLGGLVGASTKALINWLDRIWGEYLTDGSGHAKLKIHGFGITSVEIMERYPWHSVDSSAWVQAASFGEIVLHPHGRLIVSEKSASVHIEGRHLFTLSEPEKDYVLSRIEAQGYDYKRLAESPYPRAAFNINSFQEINNNLNKKDVTFKSIISELF